jgi:NADH dehydrogenase
MASRDPSYRAYLLRCWQEGGVGPGGEPGWRFSVEEVLPPRRRWGFGGRASLLAFLEIELGSAAEGPSDGLRAGDRRAVQPNHDKKGETRMILIVGATGNLGGEVCRRLATHGKPVRALARASSDPDKVKALQALGVKIAQGDVRDRASLDAACQGVGTVISTVSSMPFSYQPGENDIQAVDLGGLSSLISAAQAAGVSHFVYTSFSRQIDLDFPLRNAKRAVEQRLKESGLTYTVLRPSYFMEAWLSPVVGFDVANAKASIYGDGHAPISWISLQDVAQFAVESLDNPAARNATLELGGPEALSPLQVVHIFEEICGRPFEVQHVPAEALQAQQEAAQDPMQQSFSGLMRCYAQGDAIEMGNTLKAFPLQLTSVREYASGVVGAS